MRDIFLNTDLLIARFPASKMGIVSLSFSFNSSKHLAYILRLSFENDTGIHLFGKNGRFCLTWTINQPCALEQVI